MREWGNGGMGGMRNGLGRQKLPEAVSFLTPSSPHPLIPSSCRYGVGFPPLPAPPIPISAKNAS